MLKRFSRAVPVALLLHTAALPAQAQQVFTSNGIFSSFAQSIWASGPAFTLDTGNQFLGEQWDLGKTFGGIKDILGAKFGAEVGAETSGKLGIDYSLKVNSGSFDVQYPGATSITVPSGVPEFGGVPGAITLGTGFSGRSSLPTNNSGGVANATLQVTSPTVQASLRLEAQAKAFAGATVCFVACTGPSFMPPDINASQDLLKINPNNDHTLSVLGTTVSANQNISALGGLVNASVQIPNLDSSSATTPGGVSGNVLTSAKRDNIAAVNANIAQIAADAVGLPIPLAGNLGPFGYNLLQSNAGAALDVSQTLQFTPTAKGRLLFSAPVTPDVNGILGAQTNEIDFNYGDNVSFLPGTLQTVSFTPVTDLYGSVHNTTDLVVNGDVNVKALGLDIAGLTIGPLINASLPPTDIGAINLLDNTFTDRIGIVTGEPITVNINCGSISGGGEFKYFEICASSKLVDLGPALSSGGVVVDAYDLQNCGSYSYRLGQPDPGPSSCTLTFDHYGAAYVNTPLGRVDLPSLFQQPFHGLSTTPSSTDSEATALLSSLGYVPGAPGFDIPAGASLDSFAVPEPESGAMFGIATALVMLLAARRHGRL